MPAYMPLPGEARMPVLMHHIEQMPFAEVKEQALLIFHEVRKYDNCESASGALPLIPAVLAGFLALRFSSGPDPAGTMAFVLAAISGYGLAFIGLRRWYMDAAIRRIALRLRAVRSSSSGERAWAALSALDPDFFERVERDIREASAPPPRPAGPEPPYLRAS